MKILKTAYLDENKELRYMSANKVISTTSEALLMDYYKRKVAEGVNFFGLDTGHCCSKLEDLREIKHWKDNFDIDFRIAYGSSEETMNSYVNHEPKSFARTLGSQTKEHSEMRPGDKSLYGEWYTLHERGVIQEEIVGNTERLKKNKDFKSQVPGTNIMSEHRLGSAWAVKGTYRADWYHFYVPMMMQNEGRLTATAEELEQMKQVAPAGAKLITEAPAGLYISLTRNVQDALYQMSLRKLARQFENDQTLQERRELLEEYSTSDKAPGGKNVRMHIEDLSTALEIASNDGNIAHLEVRPVFKFVRNEVGAEEELEIADSGQGYWIPRRLHDIYFNEAGQLRRNIQGYWNDTSSAVTEYLAEDIGMPHKRLLMDFAFRLKGLNVSGLKTSAEDKNEDVEPIRIIV